MEEPFDGMRYSNLNRQADQRSIGEAVHWILFGRQEKWPQKSDGMKASVLPKTVGEGELHATFINHSTVLLQLDGMNILTDPIWSERCSPLPWFGPKRVVPPGVALEDLPRIDVVLVTHNHYDHMDRKTLEAIGRRHNPVYITSKGDRKRLLSWGLSPVEELGWWEKTTLLNGRSLHFVPAQHFARRGIFDRNKTLWGGFVIETAERSIYFAGDTGYGDHFAKIREAYGPFRLACLPIGAYLPRWFMQGIHMGPDDAVQAHLDLEADVSIPIHYGTFQLSDETIDQPVKELVEELTKRGIPHDDFPILPPGMGMFFS